MIVQRLPVVLFCLIKALEAAVPSRSDFTLADTTTVPSISQLSDQLAQLEIKVPEVNANGTEPLLSFFEISEQMAKLVGKTLTLNTKAAVRTIEEGLVQILKSNITLHDIAPTIGTLPIEAKELVLTALELKAHTLLNLLQMVYIWHDDHQYHWFVALIENEPWRNKDLKNDLGLFPLNWRNNLRAICEVDNGVLAVATRSNIPFGDALESFDKELLLLCAEYDSIRVFESTQLDPVQLKNHFGLLIDYSAVGLLKLYQNHTKTSHLHLEEYPFPTKLPANVEGFKFLLENGYNYLPMNELIKKFCKKGRLDLLKYLQSLNPALIPGMPELKYAAERNFKDILDWGRHFGTHDSFLKSPICKALLSNHHFATLRWWINVNKVILNQGEVESIAGYGGFEILQWINEQQLTNYNFQRVANAAVQRRHFPILKWIYKKYRVLPSAVYLANATGETLDWIKSKGDTVKDPLVAMRLNGMDVKYEDLVNGGMENFELLQWVFKNASFAISLDAKLFLSMSVKSKEMMLWLYDKLKIPPRTMFWAYDAGDLEGVKWASETCNIYPTEPDVNVAITKGHLHLITWIHKNLYPKRPSCLGVKALETAVFFGKLEIAEYLLNNVFPKAKVKVQVNPLFAIKADEHLAILKWAHEHEFSIIDPEQHIFAAIRNEHLPTLEWLFANVSDIKPVSKGWWELIENDLHEPYRWLLEKHFKAEGPNGLIDDARQAYGYGSLRILKILYEKYPLILQPFSLELSEKDINRANYHIYQWFAANGYPVKST